MKFQHVLPLGLALSVLALAAPQRYEMRSYVNVGGKVQSAFAWCDAPDRVLAVTQPVRADPATPQPVTLRRWLKRPPREADAAVLTATYLLGTPDPGAGNIYTPLTFPDGTGGGGRFYIHTSNVESVNDPAYRMTRVGRFRTPEGNFPCRYVPQAAFLGATSKRTVIVWDNGRAATYATRNFDGTPGVYVTGGRKITNEELTAYEFTTKNGYRYRVELWTPQYGGAGSLLVSKGNQQLLDESFNAYSVSLPAGARP
ncbi:hypothetical protein [Deinococcus aetherius]|nr:hypothetical protein [Deinococcus aetherius]